MVCAAGPQGAQRVLEGQPEQAGRNRAHDEQLVVLRAGVAPLILRSRIERPRPRKIRFELFEEHEEEDERRGAVGGDEEGEEEVVALMDVPGRRPLGAITPWPRLEIGNGSVIPGSSPRMTRWI